MESLDESSDRPVIFSRDIIHMYHSVPPCHANAGNWDLVMTISWTNCTFHFRGFCTQRWWENGVLCCVTSLEGVDHRGLRIEEWASHRCRLSGIRTRAIPWWGRHHRIGWPGGKLSQRFQGVSTFGDSVRKTRYAEHARNAEPWSLSLFENFPTLGPSARCDPMQWKRLWTACTIFF